MEYIDVPQRGMKPLVDNLQRLIVTGRNEGAAGFSLVKEIFFGNFLRLCVMRNKNNLNILVARANELIENEKETSSEVFFHGVHRTGGIHDAQNDGVGLSPQIA